jgi:transposase
MTPVPSRKKSMKYIRGKPLEPFDTRAIVSVKGYFDRNKKEFGLTEGSCQLTADALEIGVSTVKRVMADYRRDPLKLDQPPEPKGRPNYAIDCSHEEAVRSFIRNANQNGQYITISSISKLIRDKEPNTSFHPVTLTRTLDRWGFEFGKGKRTQHFKEKDEIMERKSKIFTMYKSQ